MNLNHFKLKDLKELCRNAHLAIGGNKSELIEKLLKLRNLSDSNVVELQKMCSVLGYKTSGIKDELIDRVFAAIEEPRSTPYKTSKAASKKASKKNSKKQKSNSKQVKCPTAKAYSRVCAEEIPGFEKALKSMDRKEIRKMMLLTHPDKIQHGHPLYKYRHCPDFKSACFRLTMSVNAQN